MAGKYVKNTHITTALYVQNFEIFHKDLFTEQIALQYRPTYFSSFYMTSLLRFSQSDVFPRFGTLLERFCFYYKVSRLQIVVFYVVEQSNITDIKSKCVNRYAFVGL